MFVQATGRGGAAALPSVSPPSGGYQSRLPGKAEAPWRSVAPRRLRWTTLDLDPKCLLGVCSAVSQRADWVLQTI